MSDGDTTGSGGPAQDGATGRRPSDRKRQANRQNAQRSTGPKTEEGKKESSRNAEKHGGLSTIVAPIRNGPFAEDPEAFFEEISRLVASFGPITDVELAVASRIAATLIKLGRIDSWVASVIEDKWGDGGFLSGRAPTAKVVMEILSGPMELERKYHQRLVRDLVILVTELKALQESRKES